MTTVAEWVEGARPRTLPAAIAPVLVGSGVAAWAGSFRWGAALLALVVALAVQVGVNYANDYSDGVRGTDDDRVGPRRLVGSGLAEPSAVRSAALLAFGIAGVAGLALAITTSWWLLLVGAVAIAAAWTYTGGPSPYGYRGLGEASVFLFFGLVAVIGTTYVQTERWVGAALVGGVAIGALACAILVVNNLRDIPTDAAAGKRTLAVVLGDLRTRQLYLALLVVALAGVALLAVVATRWALLGLGALPLAVASARAVLGGARGPALVPVLRDTGRLELVLAALLALGLAVG
ncbi:MAG: 1,4-dihydroxy-2-naphthoate polyprenyltransferase [Actinomycetota bacterium]|nr:1,4-dihydroxy-2-naphthoate polyprenyltransferase [Actinomycetota bacterium]